MLARTKFLVSGIVMVVFVFGGAASSQAQWSDNFDSYADGSGILGQGAWVGWNQTGADDAPVTSAQAYSDPHSLVVGGATMVDLVPEFPGVTSGTWALEVMTYVPADSLSGVSDIGFLAAHEGFEEAPATQWFGPLTMNMGAGNVNGNIDVPLIYDEWVQVRVVFDVDERTNEIFYDGVLAASQTNWSTNGGGSYNNQLAALDVWSPADASPMYYDDFNVVVVGGDVDGDVDGNGSLDANDLVYLETVWGTDDATGDLDGSGLVDLADFMELRAAAEAIGGLPPVSAAPVPTPEPATMSLLALGALAVLRRPSRKA